MVRSKRKTFRDKLVEALKKRADIKVAPECEDATIEGNASAWNDGTDEPYWKSIREKYESGNDWAWCTVHVSARYAGFVGDDYLGCCSYEGEADFKQPGGYYEQMVDDACGDLADKLIAAKVAVSTLLSRRKHA